MKSKDERLYIGLFFALVIATLALLITILRRETGSDYGFMIGVICAVLFCVIVSSAMFYLVYRRLFSSLGKVENETAAVTGKVVMMLAAAEVDLAETGDGP